MAAGRYEAQLRCEPSGADPVVFEGNEASTEEGLACGGYCVRWFARNCSTLALMAASGWESGF